MLENLNEENAPDELTKLVDEFKDILDGKEQQLVVSVLLTLIADTIEQAQTNHKLMILKGIADFTVAMGNRSGFISDIDMDEIHKDVNESSDKFVKIDAGVVNEYDSNDNEPKVANIDGDSECQDCDECTENGCIDKGK